MPRKIQGDITLDDAEDEILFTRAALKADPDAQTLVPSTDTWMSLVDDARTKDREARESVMDTDARRIVANARLDAACTRFGDDLFLACGKDTKAKRWTQFFSVAVSRFIRQPL